VTERFSSYMCAALYTVLFLFCSPYLPAQGTASSGNPQGNSQAAAESVPVFHSSVRVVLVDVIVNDKKGQFVPDLKPEDFILLEDGKPQRIAAFNAHRYQTPRSLPPLQLPPHQFTNFTPQEPGGAVTIVLLDTLNTPILQQVDARKAMLQFIEKLPPGQRVALFVLSDHPKLVQGFTGSSDVLVAAAKTIRPGFVMNSVDSPSSSSAIGIDIQSAFPAQSVMAAETRLRLTLASLQMLARAVSGYPGRKNVLWFSGQFPLRLSPEFTVNNHAQLMNQDYSEVLETAALLAASQVALYPIDVTGLNPGTNIQDRFSPDFGMMSSMGDDKRTAMEDLARETGGDAFYGTNALGDAMVRGLKQGSDYYTLAYSPTNHDWNGQYRKIEAKTSLKGVKLTFRRGYYANKEKEFSGDQAARMLATAMQPTVPESTMLLLKVQVLPPDSEHKTVRIDYAVDAHDIRFADSDDQQKHVAVDFMAAAWSKDFKDAGYTTDMVNTAFRPEAYQQVLHTGFPAHQELDLKPGNYTLRLGVLDRGSQKIGTVDVPLTITGKEALGN
jgi:VWFA-related protein